MCVGVYVCVCVCWCVLLTVPNEAFVTLATSDEYALGTLVLSSSLRRVDTSRQLVVMVTSGVSQPMRSGGPIIIPWHVATRPVVSSY